VGRARGAEVKGTANRERWKEGERDRQTDRQRERERVRERERERQQLMDDKVVESSNLDPHDS